MPWRRGMYPLQQIRRKRWRLPGWIDDGALTGDLFGADQVQPRTSASDN
jgi:hypothetical protein